MGRKKQTRPRGFFDDMNDTELLKYCFRLYGKEVYRDQLHKEDSRLYQVISNRGLISRIKTKRGPLRNLSKMSDKELLQHCFELHGREITPRQLRRKDSWLCAKMNSRGLLDKLNCDYVPNRNFSSMNNKDILDYCFSNYGRKVSPKELQDKDCSLYSVMLDRGLIIKLNRKRRTKGFFRGMTDKEILDYCFKNYGKDVTRGEVQDKDCLLYLTLRDRELLDRLGMKVKPTGFYARMTDKGILDYCFKNYGKNITRTDLSERDLGLYSAIKGRKLLYKIKTKTRQRMHFREWENYKQEMDKAIEKNGGEFPNTHVLLRMGYSHLTRNAKYYGGIAAVREKIGYNQQVRIKLARQLEEIADQVAA